MLTCHQCKNVLEVSLRNCKDITCNSCGNIITHPIKLKLGSGEKLTGLKKTTINLHHNEIDCLDDILDKMNSSSKYKIKRGQFIRLLLRKELGLLIDGDEGKVSGLPSSPTAPDIITQ